MNLEDVILRNTRANQPGAATVPAGTLYYVTDESVLERSTGAAWQSYSGASGALGINQLTGDVTAGPGVGSQAATIANSAVTLAKMANLADQRIIGNASGGAAAPAALTVSQALVLASGKLAIEKVLSLTIDGGGSAISTGIKGYIPVFWTGTIIEWVMIADQSGSIVLDIWRDTYANAPPTVLDTITAAAKPTLAAAQKNSDATLTGWTTGFTAGDIFGINVDSAATITRLNFVMKLRLT